MGGVGGEDEGVEGGLMGVYWGWVGLELGDMGCEILGDLGKGGGWGNWRVLCGRLYDRRGLGLKGIGSSLGWVKMNWVWKSISRAFPSVKNELLRVSTLCLPR